MSEFESPKNAFLVIGCGKAKIWDRKPYLDRVSAKDAYTSGLFRLCRLYAETFYPGRWLILSSRYGLVLPEEYIEKYDASFKSSRLSEKDTVITPEILKKQCRYYFNDATKVVCIAGNEYTSILRSSLQEGVQMESPLAHMGLFARMAWLRSQVNNRNSSLARSINNGGQGSIPH